MYNFARIILDDRDTYRDYETNELQPYWGQKAVRLILAVLVSIVFHDVSSEFLRALISTYAILLGFGFSVLFNISSASLSAKPSKFESLEDELAYERNTKVRSELFRNVSMFVLVAIALIVTVLVMLVVGNLNTGIERYLHQHWLKNEIVIWVVTTAKIMITSVLYFLIFESFVGFSRVIARVNFSFRRYFVERS